MYSLSIRNSLTATALAALMAVFVALPAAADESATADSYFDADNGFSVQTGSPVEEAAVPSHLRDVMEIH